MSLHDPPPRGRRKPTLLGVLTVAGDVIMISLALFVLWLGIVTAAPASAAAMRARSLVGPDGPSAPVRTILSGTRTHFRTLWLVGPIVVLIGIFLWIGVAFWLTVPAPLGVVMLAVLLCIGAIILLVSLTVPTAAHRVQGFRAVVVESARLVVARPLVSVVALAAAGAAVVIAGWLPTLAIVGLGAALVEVCWRAWGKRFLPDA
ncbi:hypothetical protein GCM10022200_17520 [Microbacterium awajiense]|uniref:Integral membrane protein n=1 Tax=Microbacterium awajiense TaxID=415214 RepID=A0ABP7AL21_9MICO